MGSGSGTGRSTAMTIYHGMLLVDKYNQYYTVVQYVSGVVTLENAVSPYT